MARNGSGTYSAPAADFPAVASTLIESTKFNNIVNDIATAMSASIAVDGQTTVTANIPMNSKKFTGVTTGSARTDSNSLGQVQDGTLNWVAGGGTADAITATYSPAITTLIDGQICCVRATAANATTTPTFAPNGLTARTIVKYGGQALVVGDIRAISHELVLRYLLASTRWELLNPNTTNVAVVDAAADTTTWPLLATNQTGSQAPTTDAGLTYNASTNTLTATTFVGALTGNADTATTATTATTVSTTVSSGAVGTTQAAADNSTKIATTAYADRLRLASVVSTSSETTVPGSDTEATFSHGLGAVPSLYTVSIRCKTTEYGYAVGDEICVTSNSDGDGARPGSTWVNSTTVGFRAQNANAVSIKRRDAGGSTVITNANWKLVFRAWL